jgi:hypothetical protein
MKVSKSMVMDETPKYRLNFTYSCKNVHIHLNFVAI